MKANELRVTNFVSFKNLVINPVLMIGYDAVELISPKGDITEAKLAEIFPIPLTEEWLLRFGFEFFRGYERNVYRLRKMIIVGGELFYYRHIQIFHVHQLQNLYSALTGEEL